MTISRPGPGELADLLSQDAASRQTRVQERQARCMAVVAFLVLLGASLAFQ